MFKRIIALLICFCFISEQTGYAQVAGQFAVPAYLSNLAPVADRFRPVQLRSIEFDPSTNNFQLLLDQGDLKSLTPGQAEESSRKLFEYFKIGLALPNSMFWVNLRPDSPDNVIDPYLEKTDLGKVLLEADLQLKKDLARFTNPDTPEGRQYWNKLYEKAEQTYSGQDIEIPTFTRPWIVPGEIIIRETPQGVFIYKATLQVMLEQDYIKDSPFYNFDDPNVKKLNEYSSDLVRQLIIPKLTREVNSSKRYAELRQVYYSLILAQWFKSKNEDNPVIDGKDLNGLASKEAWSKASYFNAYKRSFSEGEYRKEETINSPYGVTIRQYFSGGIQVAGGSLTAIPSSSLDNREYVSDFIIQNLSIGDKKGSVPRDGGNQSRGEDENDTRIPYDDEVRQAKDFLAAQGYSEIQIAGWLARGRAKLLEIAEEAGFQFSQADGSQSRRDGGEEDIIGELILPPGSKSVRLFSAPPEKNIRSKILATVYATGFRDKNDPETRIVWFRPAEAKEFSALQSNAIAESLAQANKEIKIRLGMSVQDSLEQLLSKHYLIVGRRLVIMQADGTILTAPIQEATYDRLQLIMNREQGSGRAGGFYNRDYMKHQDLRNPRGRLLTDLEETKADLLSPQHEDAVQRDGGTGDHAEAVRQQRELVQEYFDARGIDSLPEEIPANGLRALADDIRGKKHALIEQIIPLMLAHYGIPSQRKLRRFKDLMAGDLRAWTYGDLLLLRDDLRNWKIQEGMVSANTPQPQGMLSRRFKTLAVFAFFVVPSFFIGGFVHAYVSGMADDHTSDPLGPDMQPLHLTTFNHIEKIPYSTDYTSFFLSEPEGLTDNTSHPVSISLVVNPLPDLYLEQQNASYVKTHDVPLLLVVNGNAVQNLSRYLNEYTLYGARDGHIIEILDITGRDPKAIAEYLNDKGRMGYQIGFVGDQVDVLSGVPADHDELQDLEALRDEVNDLVREYRNTHKDTRDIDKELLKHRDLTDQSFSAQVSMVGMIQRGEKETRPEEWNELRERHARLQADLRQAEEELGPIIPAASRFKEFLFEKEEAGAIDRYIQAGNDPQALFPDTYTEREAFHWSSYLAQGAFNSIKVYKTAGAMHAPQDSGAIKDIQKTRALRTVLEKELGAYKEKYGVAFQQDYEAFEAQIPDAHTIVSMDLLHNEPNEQWTKEKRTDMYQILDLQSFLGQAGYDSVYQAADGRIYESEEAFRAYEDYVLFREHALERWEKEPDVAHAVIWLYLIEPDLARTAMSGNVSITLVDELPLPNPWAEGMALPRIGFPHVLVKGADIYILKDSFDSYSTDLRVRIVAHESSHAVNEIHAYNDAGPFGVLRWALWYMLNPGDEEKRVRMREQKVGNISGKVIDPYFSDRIDRLDPDEHKYLIEKINEAREDSAPDSNSTDIFPAEVQRTYELTTRGALFGLFLGPAALLTRMRAVKSRLVWFARRAFGQEDIADRMRILSREAKIVEKTIEFAVPPVEARMNGQRAIEENNKFLALVDSVMEDTILFGLKYKEPFTIRFREFFGNGNGFEGNMATITETTLKTLIRKLAVNGYDAVATFHDREYMGKIGCADRPIPEKVRLTFAAHWATHPQTGKESLRITIADNGAGLFAADTRHKSFVEGSNLYFGGAGLDTRMISKGDSATGAQGLLAYLWGLAGVTIPKNQDNEDATEQFYSLTYGDDGWGATVTVWLPRECLVQRDGGTERPAAQRDDDKSNETARFDQQADDIREKIRKIFDASKETWKDPKLQLTEEVLERYFRQVLRKFNIGTTEEVIWRMVQKHMNKSIKKEIILIRHSVESSVSQQRRMEENDVLLTDFLNAIHVNPPVPYDVKFVPGHIVEKYVGVYSAGYFPFHQTYVIPSELDGPLLTMLLLHEGLHHNSRGLRSIGKILDEGVTEYAAWKIATSSLKDFLIDAADTNYPLDLQAQELERKVLGVKNSYAPALFLACRVIEAVGEDVVFEAYFKGNIKVLIAALGKDAIRQLKGLDKLKPYDEKIMPQVPKIIDAIEKNQASHNDTQRPKVQLDGGEVRDIDAQQQDLAGIDFRALHGGGQPQQAPVMMPQAMLEMQQLARNSKIQDLDAEWKAIEAQMRAKEMPYARMKEYVAVCVCRPDAGEHLEKTARCILNILRLEEEQGLATRTELTDILVCIG